MLANSYKLSGISRANSYFRFNGGNTLNLDKIDHVLRGKLLGTMCHDAVPIQYCETVVNNFWNSEIARERNDGVAAISIGAYHYKKELQAYFKQVELAKTHVDKLFHGIPNFIEELIEKFTAYFAMKGINFRLARHNEYEASKFVIRSCNALTDYIIYPHDDVAQCRTKNQKGFEIEKIPNYEMVALNICLDNHNDGQLNIWNIQPDDAARTALNIEETGYSYPLYLVEDFKKIELPIRAGDLYCFNGRNIHAVKSKFTSKHYRTTITFFMGYINDNTVIYWT